MMAWKAIIDGVIDVIAVRVICQRRSLGSAGLH